MASTVRNAIIEYIDNNSPTTTADAAEDIGCSKSYVYKIFRELLNEDRAIEYGSNQDGETLWISVESESIVDEFIEEPFTEQALLEDYQQKMSMMQAVLNTDLSDDKKLFIIRAIIWF